MTSNEFITLSAGVAKEVKQGKETKAQATNNAFRGFVTLYRHDGRTYSRYVSYTHARFTRYIRNLHAKGYVLRDTFVFLGSRSVFIGPYKWEYVPLGNVDINTCPYRDALRPTKEGN